MEENDSSRKVYLVFRYPIDENQYREIPFSSSKTLAIEYIRFHNLEEGKNCFILELTEEQFIEIETLPSTMSYLSEIDDMEGCFITSDEFEWVNSSLDSDLTLLIDDLKSIRKRLKAFKGGDSRRLKKQIDRFLGKDRNTTDRYENVLRQLDLPRYAKQVLNVKGSGYPSGPIDE